MQAGEETEGVSGRHANVIAGMTALVVLLATATKSQASPMYSVTDLGKPGTVMMNDLNDAGQVVGFRGPGPGVAGSYAFVYSGSPAGTVTPLGGSSDPTHYPAVRDSLPVAINNNDQILATDWTGTVTGTRNGSFVYASGQMATVPGTAVAFNDQGQVTGYTGIASTGDPRGPLNPRGYLYDLATMKLQQLTTAGEAPTEPHAINNSGQVVGNVITQVGPTAITAEHPFL
jgi:hypothetical protein